MSASDAVVSKAFKHSLDPCLSSTSVWQPRSVPGPPALGAAPATSFPTLTNFLVSLLFSISSPASQAGRTCSWHLFWPWFLQSTVTSPTSALTGLAAVPFAHLSTPSNSKLFGLLLLLSLLLAVGRRGWCVWAWPWDCACHSSPQLCGWATYVTRWARLQLRVLVSRLRERFQGNLSASSSIMRGCKSRKEKSSVQAARDAVHSIPGAWGRGRLVTAATVPPPPQSLHTCRAERMQQTPRNTASLLPQGLYSRRDAMMLSC